MERLRITTTLKPRGTKHLLCKDADTELAFMTERIAVIRQVISSSRFRFLGHHPIDKAGQHIVPPIPTSLMIQERMDAFETTILHVRCYIKLRGNSTSGIPDVGFDGAQWFKELLHQFRLTQQAFRGLVDDVLYQMLRLFVGVGIDIASHASLYKHLQKSLTGAIERIKRAFQPRDNPDAHTEFCAYFIQICFKEYTLLPVTERLIPVAATLGQTALVQHVACLFQVNLKRWDRMHGLRVPAVRRLLEVFAYELEDAFTGDTCDLTPRFDTVGY